MAATNSAAEAAVEALTKAMIPAERTELEKWTADELIYGHSTGRKETKKEFVDGVIKGPFAKIVSTDRTVTVIDNVALVYQTITRTKPNGDTGGMKELLTLMSRNGQWKVIGRQTTKI